MNKKREIEYLQKRTANIRDSLTKLSTKVRDLEHNTVIKELTINEMTYHNIRDIMIVLLNHLNLEIKNIDPHVILQKKKK